MMSRSSDWYDDLYKSKLTPPDWVFGVVWSLLYGSIGVYYTLMLLYTQCSDFTCMPMILFTIQMGLNFLWPLVFFRLEKPKIALFLLLGMIGLSAATFYYSFLINQTYTYILIPYLVWICFACYLNGYIVAHN
jgi:translocator protein